MSFATGSEHRAALGARTAKLAAGPTSRRLTEAACRRDGVIWPRPVWIVALSSLSWHDKVMDATVVLGRQGRLVIPAEVRAALGLSPGDRLHLHLTGDRLVLQRPQDALSELRRLGAAVPPGRSLVEELLADRRAAAALE